MESVQQQAKVFVCIHEKKAIELKYVCETF